MSQPAEPETGTPSAPKTGRGKLIAIVVAVLVLVAVGAAAVYYLTQPPGPTGTIKVGFTISLTGRYNVEGTNSRNGIMTAANWINSHGGIKAQGTVYNISLVFYDDQSIPGNVNTLYPQIVEQDKAQFLLAPYSTLLTGTAAPIADNYDRVMLSHGGAADTIWTQTTRRNLVEVLSPASVYLKGAVEWIHTNHGADKIAVLHESDPFSTLAADSAIRYAQSLGLNVVYNQSYPTGATDLSPQLNAAMAAGADDLLGGGHFNDGLLIMNQLKTIWTPKFVSLLVAVTEPSFQAQLQATANNVTGPSQWESAVAYGPTLAQSLGLPWYGPTPTEFTQLYGSLNAGASPSYHSAEAGGALLVLAQAIGRANSLNTTDVRAALGNMHIMNFFGQFQIAASGLQIAHSMIVVQWQAGALKVVYPADVAQASVQYPYTGSSSGGHGRMPALEALATDLAFGVLLGCVFAVIAHGLNLIWGFAKIVNVAHGVFIMLGAYGAYFLNLYPGINPLLSAPVDAAIGLAAGVGFYFGFLHRELRGKESIAQQSEMVTLVATFGLSLFISNLALRLWTGNFVGIPWSPGSIFVGFLQLPLGALYVAIASVAIIA